MKKEVLRMALGSMWQLLKEQSCFAVSRLYVLNEYKMQSKFSTNSAFFNVGSHAKIQSVMVGNWLFCMKCNFLVSRWFLHTIAILLYLESVVSLRVVAVGVLHASVTAEVTHICLWPNFLKWTFTFLVKKVQENQHFLIDYLGKPKVVEKHLRISISSVL